jgi:hypothetical protein
MLMSKAGRDPLLRQASMSPTPNRTVRAAWIPWVLALVALFGLNALAPDHSNSKIGESSDDIELSQVAHDAQKLGRIFNPQIFLHPTPSGEIGLLDSSSLFLCIETGRELTAVPSLRGAVQGRAPPAGSRS